MPVTSLNNISVPTTEVSGSNNTLLMPKLQYRFRVLFDSFGTGGDTLQMTKEVIDVTRPTVNFEQMTIDAYNSRSYLAGKHTWEPITLNLRDDANNKVQQIVGQQLQRQFDFYEQSSAVSGNSYKFQTKIEILDGGNGSNPNTIIDRFHLVGCYLENVNYNNLAYSTSEPVTVTLSIRYDNAIQYGVGGGDKQSNSIGIGELNTRVPYDNKKNFATLGSNNDSLTGPQ